jgi:hypothetical protein
MFKHAATKDLREKNKTPGVVEIWKGTIGIDLRTIY